MSKQKKKILGIPGWILGDATFGVSKSYLHFISQFGKPLILTPDHDIEEVDMLLLPGGKDISPGTYGARPSYWTGEPNMMLEWFDAQRLPGYIEENIPVLGICRGAQRLWAFYGGEIDQHNDWHAQSKSGEPWDQCHGLAYTADFRAEYKSLLTKVNSRHHQTMDARNGVPEELEVVAFAQATAKEGKERWFPSIVEIFKHKERPIFGIQGHPEDMIQDDLTPMIINSFLNP